MLLLSKNIFVFQFSLCIRRYILQYTLWQDYERKSLSCVAGGRAKWYSPYGGRFGTFQQNYEYKCINILTHPSHSLLEIYPKIHLHKYKKYVQVIHYIIYNNKTLGTTQMPTHRALWVNYGIVTQWNTIQLSKRTRKSSVN